jgi:hypothetical protein
VPETPAASPPSSPRCPDLSHGHPGSFFRSSDGAQGSPASSRGSLDAPPVAQTSWLQRRLAALTRN